MKSDRYGVLIPLWKNLPHELRQHIADEMAEWSDVLRRASDSTSMAPAEALRKREVARAIDAARAFLLGRVI